MGWIFFQRLAIEYSSIEKILHWSDLQYMPRLVGFEQMVKSKVMQLCLNTLCYYSIVIDAHRSHVL